MAILFIRLSFSAVSTTNEQIELNWKMIIKH
jgi:hypothetical protein